MQKICGWKVSRRSKITPRNRTSGTTEFVYHGCVFRGRDDTRLRQKVHAATLARRNTMTVGVAPFYNVVDGSLQLPFNHAHVRTFITGSVDRPRIVKPV
ncbi:hypothetical protein TNCV_1886941 [Trichonephila clavipes]|nr:hypothetical protein TNCV_1886941 [Trichonephila clavipes]